MSLRYAVIAFSFIMILPAASGRARSDLASPRQREAVVERAEQLARRPTAASFGDLPNPFDPPSFDRAEHRGESAGANVEAAAPADREILERLAARIPATGAMSFGGEEMLTIRIPPYRLTVGDPIIVTENGKEYELEIVSIERTNFTVRYHGEETIRAIRLAK